MYADTMNMSTQVQVDDTHVKRKTFSLRIQEYYLYLHTYICTHKMKMIIEFVVAISVYMWVYIT